MILALVMGSLLVGNTGYYFGLEAKPRFSISVSPGLASANIVSTLWKLDTVSGETWAASTAWDPDMKIRWVKMPTTEDDLQPNALPPSTER